MVAFAIRKDVLLKTLILFYSFGGKTRKWAKEYAAANESTDEVEIKERCGRNIVTAFLPGCPQAMKRKGTAIHTADAADDLSVYDKFIVAAPIWAGFPAPAFNSILQLIPKGKKSRSCIDFGERRQQQVEGRHNCFTEGARIRVSGVF